MSFAPTSSARPSTRPSLPTSRAPSQCSGVLSKSQDSTSEQTTPIEKKDSPGRAKLRSWLHALMSVVLSDGRTLVGTFVCTDRDTNIILSSCTEHLPHTHTDGEEEARMLGLAMVPGRHIVSLSIDERTINQRHHQQQPQFVLQDDPLEEQSAAELNAAAAAAVTSAAALNIDNSTLPITQSLDPPVGYT
ncbi:N-alpha-acetyltransferase 38, NatC auxiliary subunit [Hyalella azteca]|nr:N-alpha-acetyltransferase 38, NatC auxiliary subunit [Hyalella azteca]